MTTRIINNFNTAILYLCVLWPWKLSAALCKREMMEPAVSDGRNETRPNKAKAVQAAQELCNAGENKLGTDEEVFNKILAHESFPQLRLIFEEYKNISGRTIEQAIENELDGSLKDGLLAIVECVQDSSTFFAKRLNDSMAGGGTDDNILIRIIISRSEIDLGNIKAEYEHLYDKTLEYAVENETSGEYRKVLLSLVQGN